MKKPFALIIRDGWGYNPRPDYNAIYHAKTPNHDIYCAHYPTTLISASGVDVGLPDGNQGSSEVGHLNMGAGRVVYQNLVRINKSVSDGEFFKNQRMIDALNYAKNEGCRVHLMGLVQDQGVHAHTDHLLALMKFAKQQGLSSRQLLVHVFSDGRDTPPSSTMSYVQPVLDFIQAEQTGHIASISGRYYSMDRDNRWDRVQLAYDMLTQGISTRPPFAGIEQAVADAYNLGETDEFIKPRITNDFEPIRSGDVVVFFNYRLDRTRELTRAFVENEFSEFPVLALEKLTFICMTEYYDGVANSTRAHVEILFPPIALVHLFGQVFADLGLRQLRIAETEKYAHVTFFFNGQSDVVFDQEDRVLIPSPRVATYDLQPEMSAVEVKNKIIELINADLYDLIVLNFANPDMVGHTGVFEAAVKAIETVDACVGEVVQTILNKDGVVFLTSDHGNAEQMIDYETGQPHTAHTTNLVWLHLISNRSYLQKNRIQLKVGGRLADIAPTMLSLMNITPPKEMDGANLLN